MQAYLSPYKTNMQLKAQFYNRFTYKEIHTNIHYDTVGTLVVPNYTAPSAIRPASLVREAAAAFLRDLAELFSDNTPPTVSTPGPSCKLTVMNGMIDCT